MTQAQNGDTVKVHYTGKLTDGIIFDSSIGSDPLEFCLGEGHVIAGFEQAIMGMSAGESKTVTIPSHEAYGEYYPELAMVVSRQQLPPDFDLEIGQELEISQPDGQIIPVVVTELSESNITLDANHPLAGQDLVFELELVAIS